MANKPINIDSAMQILISFLFAVGCLAYIYGIYEACSISLQKDPKATNMPLFLSSIITSIGAVLATNLGAVLGISVTTPNSKFSPQALRNPFAVFSDSSVTAVQIIASYIYILTLVAVSIVWGKLNFSTDTDKVVFTIPELTKTFLGVIAGVFAITLAKKS